MWNVSIFPISTFADLQCKCMYGEGERSGLSLETAAQNAIIQVALLMLQAALGLCIGTARLIS